MSIEVPMHSVIKYTPVRGGGWSESFHSLDAEDGSIGPPEPPRELTSAVSELTMNSASHSSLQTPIWGDHMASRSNNKVLSSSAPSAI